MDHVSRSVSGCRQFQFAEHLDLGHAARKLTRATFGDGSNQRPVWTGDGKHLVFMSNRDGFLNLYRQRLDGSQAVHFTTGADRLSLMDLSPDGTQMLVRTSTAKQGLDLI